MDVWYGEAAMDQTYTSCSLLPFEGSGVPLVAPDGALYVGIAGNEFFKLDALTGEVIWGQNQLVDYGGPPAYGQNMVFFGTGGSGTPINSMVSAV